MDRNTDPEGAAKTTRQATPIDDKAIMLVMSELVMKFGVSKGARIGKRAVELISTLKGTKDEDIVLEIVDTLALIVGIARLAKPVPEAPAAPSVSRENKKP